MSGAEDRIVEGVVEAWAHDQATVRVEVNGVELRVLARRNGQLTVKRVRLSPGDRVRAELVDERRGRIVERLPAEGAESGREFGGRVMASERRRREAAGE